MYKFGKAIAVALAATMVFGSAITSFATEPTTSVDSTGTGSSEGHVVRKTIDITLPTVTSGSTPFAYIMDPERLIAETGAKKYPNTVWPAESDDTGVYFNEGAIEDGDDAGKTQYGKDSIVTTITNKSSHKLNITVKAEAVSADTDIPLVASNAIAGADAASLYLGLAVGSEEKKPVLKDTAAETTVEVAGTPANYKVDWNTTKNAYEFRKLTLEEFKGDDDTKTQDDYDATWKTTTFNLEGAVTSGKDVADGVTAPQVKVTWSWADPEAEPEEAAPSVATTSYTLVADTPVEVTASFGAGDLAATAITGVEKADGGALSTASYSISGNKVTFTAAWATAIYNKLGDGDTATYKIVFDDANTTKIALTFSK